LGITVIVIGPDNSGKSTLAAKLKDSVIGEHHKAIHLDDDDLTFDTVVQEIAGAREREEIVIWDRWYYPDDMIYNPIVVGRHSKLSPHVKFVEGCLNVMNTMFLFVTADKDDLKARLRQRGDDYITEDMYEQILRNYDTFIQNTNIPYKVINTSNHNQVVTLELAKIYIEQFYEERMGKVCELLR
jgi:thymidylate kinase